ncbi:MAG: sigma-70 family RNA polymerase sigma factor [Bacteroidetes bacterium]|jgi:RNA polymerase sigma-70 factor (ECF subfamily)|nr:sigma-70 family RNA polymerase sigma factor [Bacteroidota bacterium]
MTDKELLKRIRQNDPPANRELVNAYQQLVYTTSMGFVHNSHDAADITQEVFIKFFESLDSFRGDAKISTWLYRITVNVSLNMVRNERKRKYSLEIKDIDIPAANDTNYDKELENEQIKNALSQALAKLPKRQQSVFVLSRYNDMSYHEIAAVENISVSAVESLLYRARRNLQKYLKNFYEKNYK